MAPRSPTQAFDPTPALAHHKHNYSPLNDREPSMAVESYPSSGPARGVHFSNPPVNMMPRAHSIATDGVPLLPAIPSASQIPRQAFRMANNDTGIDINAYMEHCRNCYEQLRLAHESEKKTWDIERTAMKTRIANLEFELNRSRDTRRRSSQGSRSTTRSVRSDFKATHYPNNLGSDMLSASVSQTTAPPESLTSPVWKGPEQHPPAARVFLSSEADSEQAPDGEAFPSLSKEISPTNAAPVENVPVPIEKVEPTLDGITLKSAGPALTSSFVTKIISPQFGSPAHTPSPRPPIEPSRMAIDATTLLAPLDEKLKRHAGHTPMNFDGAAPSNDTSDQVTQLPTPLAEDPPAPAPTKRPPLRPSENSDSYFSTTDLGEKTARREATILEEDEEAEEQPHFEPEDDRPLKGPLMLDPSARSAAADVFLSTVDAKLMAAVKEVSPTRRESVLSENGEPVQVPATALQAVEAAASAAKSSEPDDDMPKLKLKKSMNFGSAYGSSVPGRW